MGYKQFNTSLEEGLFDEFEAALKVGGHNKKDITNSLVRAYVTTVNGDGGCWTPVQIRSPSEIQIGNVEVKGSTNTIIGGGAISDS